jgi:hypothetical protein
MLKLLRQFFTLFHYAFKRQKYKLQDLKCVEKYIKYIKYIKLL